MELKSASLKRFDTRTSTEYLQVVTLTRLFIHHDLPGLGPLVSRINLVLIVKAERSETNLEMPSPLDRCDRRLIQRLF